MRYFVVIGAIYAAACKLAGPDTKSADQLAAEAHVAQIQAAEAEKIRETKHRVALRGCLDIADMRYWHYIELNGRPVRGKPGTWRAVESVWNTAAANKANDIAACKLEVE